MRVLRIVALSVTAAAGALAVAAHPAAAGPAKVFVAPPAGTYVVQWGDYMIGIAQRAGVPAMDLLRANNLTLASVIVPGQKIIIPAGGHVPAVALAPIAPPAPTAPPAQVVPATPVVPAHNPGIDIAIDAAKAQIGKPYQFGYDGPNAFDCSGLVRYAFAKAGLGMLHNTLLQKASFPAVATNDLRAGDVVFFHENFSHEALYLGNGMIIQAPAPHMNVQISSVPLGWVTAAIRPLI